MKTPMDYDSAQRTADALAEALQAGCERLAIAGSVRRREPRVGDFEIVAIPRRPPGLFDGVDADAMDLEQVIDALIDQGRMARGERMGPRYRQYELPRLSEKMGAPVALDLFLVTAATWGVQLAIRTGPQEFSRALVTRRCYGGYLPNDCTVEQGRLWRGRQVDVETGQLLEPGTPLATPSEADFLKLTVGRWIHPDQRGRLVVAR